MKGLKLTTLLFLLTSSLAAQFRMVGTGSWTSSGANEWTATVNFSSDLTGNSYLPNQITTSFRVFTGREQTYDVTAVANATFTQADLTITATGTTNNAPIGQIMVYDPDGRATLPQVPFASNGATAQMNAAVDTYNQKQAVGSNPTADNVNLNPAYDVDGDGSNETTLQAAIEANPPVTVETFNGLTTGNTVTVSATLPSNLSKVLVFRNGLIQESGIDYTISGQVITFIRRNFENGERAVVKF